METGKAIILAGALVLVVAAAALFFNYAAPQSGANDSENFSLPALQSAYRAAVMDAENATQEKIYGNLTRIVPENTALEWNANGQVLVTTWTSYAGYDNFTGKELNLSREAWVSIDGEVKAFCNSIPEGVNVSLRMEELLGVPPASGKTRFVQMFVSPEDLFRPCPDPEITDSECGLDFPENASAAHRVWFNSLSAISYGENGYPWTRLGYTYDWGSPSHVGLSEFVVGKGAAVLVYDVESNEEYC